MINPPPQQPLRTELTVEGHHLVAQTYNPGAPGFPILLLHGVMSSLPFWTDYLVEPFLPYGPCTALSLPGHYPAVFPPNFRVGDLTAQNMAGLLHAALQRLSNNQPALVVGHSTGGFAALALAIYHPESVRGIVSVAGFAQGNWGGWLRIYQWLSRHPSFGRFAMRSLLRLGSDRKAFYASASYHTPLPPGTRTPEETERMIEENYQAFRGFDAHAMQVYFAAMSRIDILPHLPIIRVPVLALCGDADPAVPPKQSRRIAAAIPGAELAVISGGVGHMPFYQKPEAYRAVLDAWLRRQAR